MPYLDLYIRYHMKTAITRMMISNGYTFVKTAPMIGMLLIPGTVNLAETSSVSLLEAFP